MITCQACGTENPPDALFCTKCARKLDAETQRTVVETRVAHTGTGLNWSRIAYAVIAAAVVIIVIAFVLIRVL